MSLVFFTYFFSIIIELLNVKDEIGFFIALIIPASLQIGDGNREHHCFPLNPELTSGAYGS